MNIEFDVKFGHNIVQIPLPERAKHQYADGSTNLFADKVTIYNDIPKNAVEDRHFDRYVIPLCNIQGGFVDKANGTIANIVNAKTVITKAVEQYLPPMEYAALPVDQRKDHFTAQSGDFVVLAEVDDVVTTAAEFSALQQKYKNNGIKLSSVTAYIYGMAADNVTMTSV